MDLFKSADEIVPYLNYTWKRHKVILSNLANADTPNYKTKDVSFNIEEPAQLRTTRDKHIKAVASENFKVFEVGKRLIGNDLNDVSIEEEMAKLSQNRIAYEVYMKFATNSFDKLKNIIREGRQ
ncbi:MAG: flagellar basal body rod protein FlgB [Aquificaceae bacterium]